MNLQSAAPIGIFDSGIGGLTVAKAVMEALPNEDIIYFGDTARVPYGIKSEETVRQYALQITEFLLQKGVKMILIACNTVSASAKNEILELAGSIPVLDVITSGTEAALEYGASKKVGVIGTLATVNSGAYVHAISEKNESTSVVQKACPLLVPLAEEGWTENEIAVKTLQEYLSVFSGEDIEALILGCTHYPLFKRVIPGVLEDSSVAIIDSADSIARSVERYLTENNLLNSSGGKFECFVSDRPQRFRELAERFLGRYVSDTAIVSL